MTGQLEDLIRMALYRTASSLSVPDVAPGDRLLRVAPPARRKYWGRVLLAAASVLVLGGTALAVQRRADGPDAGGMPGASAPAHHFETPTVVMDAASVEVIAGGRSWTVPDDVTVDGDPGMPDEYSTLELTWHDGGVEQRIFIYFRSDGVDWWADEIRTYNGSADGDWYQPAATGEFFRSPLGTAFSGNLDLPNLHIEGLQLQAFLRPDLCDSPSAPIALVADYPIVDAYADGGFGATFQVLDTATCEPLPVADFTFEFVAADPSIVSIDAEQLADYPPVKFRIGLDLLGEGATTITATARDQSGDIVGSAQMAVNVQPPIDEVAPVELTAPDTIAAPN